MDWWIRRRADLWRPERPPSVGELPFLVGSTVAIVATAEVTDSGSALDLLLAS